MEWLMEELEAPLTSSSSSQRGKSNHSNGHITTKPVNTDGLRSFSLDEDSEDEVLSVPGVRVVKSSGASRHSAAHRSALLQVSDTFGITPAADKLGEKIAHNVVVFFFLFIPAFHRRRATRTWWGSWRSRTGRRRTASHSRQA